MEQDFVFLGLLVLENRLKLETTPVITQLHEANIRIVMVTGRQPLIHYEDLYIANPRNLLNIAPGPAMVYTIMATTLFLGPTQSKVRSKLLLLLLLLLLIIIIFVFQISGCQTAP